MTGEVVQDNLRALAVSQLAAAFVDGPLAPTDPIPDEVTKCFNYVPSSDLDRMLADQARFTALAATAQERGLPQATYRTISGVGKRYIKERVGAWTRIVEAAASICDMADVMDADSERADDVPKVENYLRNLQFSALKSVVNGYVNGEYLAENLEHAGFAAGPFLLEWLETQGIDPDQQPERFQAIAQAYSTWITVKLNGVLPQHIDPINDSPLFDADTDLAEAASNAMFALAGLILPGYDKAVDTAFDIDETAVQAIAVQPAQPAGRLGRLSLRLVKSSGTPTATQSPQIELKGLKQLQRSLSSEVSDFKPDAAEAFLENYFCEQVCQSYLDTCSSVTNDVLVVIAERLTPESCQKFLESAAKDHS